MFSLAKVWYRNTVCRLYRAPPPSLLCFSWLSLIYGFLIQLYMWILCIFSHYTYQRSVVIIMNHFSLPPSIPFLLFMVLSWFIKANEKESSAKAPFFSLVRVMGFTWDGSPEHVARVFKEKRSVLILTLLSRYTDASNWSNSLVHPTLAHRSLSYHLLWIPWPV